MQMIRLLLLVVLTLLACPQRASSQPAPLPVGRYAATLPSADRVGRELLLLLAADHAATLRTDYKSKPPVVETGTWKADGDRVIITLTRKSARPTARPTMATFTFATGALSGVDLDPKRWGSAELTFTRDTAGGLIGGAWQLTRIVRGQDAPIAPKDPARYTLAFNDDGSVQLLADCNTGHGKYTADGNKVTFGPIATTRVACPPGSLDSIFLKALNGTDTFSIDDGELQLTAEGQQTLTFDRVR